MMAVLSPARQIIAQMNDRLREEIFFTEYLPKTCKDKSRIFYIAATHLVSGMAASAQQGLSRNQVRGPVKTAFNPLMSGVG